MAILKIYSPRFIDNQREIFSLIPAAVLWAIVLSSPSILRTTRWARILQRLFPAYSWAGCDLCWQAEQPVFSCHPRGCELWRTWRMVTFLSSVRLPLANTWPSLSHNSLAEQIPLTLLPPQLACFLITARRKTMELSWRSLHNFDRSSCWANFQAYQSTFKPGKLCDSVCLLRALFYPKTKYPQFACLFGKSVLKIPSWLTHRKSLGPHGNSTVNGFRLREVQLILAIKRPGDYPSLHVTGVIAMFWQENPNLGGLAQGGEYASLWGPYVRQCLTAGEIVSNRLWSVRRRDNPHCTLLSRREREFQRPSAQPLNLYQEVYRVIPSAILLFSCWQCWKSAPSTGNSINWLHIGVHYSHSQSEIPWHFLPVY